MLFNILFNRAVGADRARQRPAARTVETAALPRRRGLRQYHHARRDDFLRAPAPAEK